VNCLNPRIHKLYAKKRGNCLLNNYLNQVIPEGLVGSSKKVGESINVFSRFIFSKSPPWRACSAIAEGQGRVNLAALVEKKDFYPSLPFPGRDLAPCFQVA
jgi:hypothetical protein